jgi:hypothetical protein
MNRPQLIQLLIDDFRRKSAEKRACYSKQFVESEHPRDGQGQFSSSGGSKVSPKTDPPKSAGSSIAGFKKDFVRAVRGLHPEFLSLIRAIDFRSLRRSTGGKLPPEFLQALTPEYREAIDKMDIQFLNDVHALDQSAIDEMRKVPRHF